MDKTTSPKDLLTVMVFKDAESSRTLHIPIQWFSRLGWAFFLMVCLTLFSIGFSVRMGLMAPTREEPRFMPPPPVLAPAQPAAPVQPVAQAPVTAINELPSALQVSLYSGGVKGVANGRIAIETPILKWSSGRKTWDIQFQLKYLLEDGGRQSGRFILIARGPEVLMTYPEGVLGTPGAAFLIDSSKGETFAVGRFREVKAEFGPIASKKALTHVQVIAVSPENELILNETIPLDVKPSN